MEASGKRFSPDEVTVLIDRSIQGYVASTVILCLMLALSMLAIFFLWCRKKRLLTPAYQSGDSRLSLIESGSPRRHSFDSSLLLPKKPQGKGTKTRGTSGRIREPHFDSNLAKPPETKGGGLEKIQSPVCHVAQQPHPVRLKSAQSLKRESDVLLKALDNIERDVSVTAKNIGINETASSTPIWTSIKDKILCKSKIKTFKEPPSPTYSEYHTPRGHAANLEPVTKVVHNSGEPFRTAHEATPLQTAASNNDQTLFKSSQSAQPQDPVLVHKSPARKTNYKMINAVGSESKVAELKRKKCNTLLAPGHRRDKSCPPKVGSPDNVSSRSDNNSTKSEGNESSLKEDIDVFSLKDAPIEPTQMDNGSFQSRPKVDNGSRPKVDNGSFQSRPNKDLQINNKRLSSGRDREEPDKKVQPRSSFKPNSGDSVFLTASDNSCSCSCSCHTGADGGCSFCLALYARVPVHEVTQFTSCNHNEIRSLISQKTSVSPPGSPPPSSKQERLERLVERGKLASVLPFNAPKSCRRAIDFQKMLGNSRGKPLTQKTIYDVSSKFPSLEKLSSKFG